MRRISETILITAFLQVIAIGLQSQPPVRFVAESIDFRYEEGLFFVSGIYSFVTSGRSTVKIDLNYPFPFNRAGLDTVVVFNLNEGDQVHYEFRNNAVHFPIQVTPGDTLRMNISYRQRISSDTIRYILTTTSRWGEPLKKGIYRFICREPGIDPRFNYPPVRISEKDGQKQYLWIETDFMPKEDFIIILQKE